MDKKLTRRSFLQRAVAAGSLLSVPGLIPARALGLDGQIAPSNRITLGGIGINHRGGYVLGYFLQQPDVHFLAISDVRRDRREAVKKTADDLYGTKDTAMYRDFREMLERKDIDAVLIATGDRWHTTASVYASRAGKDIYCEKPCALTIDQCRILAETMKRNGTIFQGGTQRRNVDNCRFACEYVRSGKLGKIHTAHASIYYMYYRTDWLPAQPTPDRDLVDWDLWLGPAPWRPYNSEYVMQGRWRAHYDFDSGARHLDWGAHTVDLCQYGLNKDGDAPVSYHSEGNSIFAEYSDGVKLIMRPDGWLGLGTCPVRFEGDEGWLEFGDSGNVIISLKSWKGETKNILTPPDPTNRLSFGECPKNHVRNFVDCVKNRRQPVCNPEVIRSSHTVCHAAALSWILQRDLKFDPKKIEFIGDEQANRMRARVARAPWVI